MRPDRYITVAEVAELLRLSSQTVYRWCRSGKLSAVKLGKEWRIPLDQVRHSLGPSRRLPLAQLFAMLADQFGHVMGVVEDRQAMGRMAAMFAESAVAMTNRLIYLRWTEDPGQIQQWLRPAMAPDRQESKLRIIDMAETYERDDITGIDAVLEEFTETGDHHCGLGTPQEYFSHYSERLAQLEARYHALLKHGRFCLLCLYSLADMDAGRALPPLVELMEHHDAVVFFDGEYALLLRPRA